VAILPVPVVVRETVEYPEPNPLEEWHVRAPGEDYFERYKKFFPRVEIIDSAQFPEECQLYVHEDCSSWPTKNAPLRTATPGSRHKDYVPLCFK